MNSLHDALTTELYHLDDVAKVLMVGAVRPIRTVGSARFNLTLRGAFRLALRMRKKRVPRSEWEEACADLRVEWLHYRREPWAISCAYTWAAIYALGRHPDARMMSSWCYQLRSYRADAMHEASMRIKVEAQPEEDAHA